MGRTNGGASIGDMETRERMEVVRQMVVEVETQDKRNQKRHNDKKARTRNFEVG